MLDGISILPNSYNDLYNNYLKKCSRLVFSCTFLVYAIFSLRPCFSSSIICLLDTKSLLDTMLREISGEIVVGRAFVSRIFIFCVMICPTTFKSCLTKLWTAWRWLRKSVSSLRPSISARNYQENYQKLERTEWYLLI